MHGSEDRRMNSLSHSQVLSIDRPRAALFAARGALRRAVIFERLATLSDMQAEDIMFHRLPRCFMVVTAVCRERRAARMPTVEDNQPPEKGALGVPQGSPSRKKGGPGAG